jgi:hypothetical protein
MGSMARPSSPICRPIAASSAGAEAVTDYKALLEHSYNVAIHDECPPHSRLQWLADQIFDFTTYESEAAELFARKAVEVSEAITNGTTFEYIEDDDRRMWYLLMCNMPFFANRLDWGSSIRGAWWSHGPMLVSSCGLYIGDEQLLDMELSGDQWREFMRAVVAFAQITNPLVNKVGGDDVFDAQGKRDSCPANSGGTICPACLYGPCQFARPE